jgi:cyclopropane-fatty-acyl-phospholipid synthase
MSLVTAATGFIERTRLPDWMTSAGVSYLVERTRQKLARADAITEQSFAAGMGAHPVAYHTDDANRQHYELPEEFFGIVLGPHRKYSSCLYKVATDTLEQAETNALAETCAHAGLADGQNILELGCGWGSLSLWMAGHYPNARITSVSNSNSQREYIMKTARERGYQNLNVVTADMNVFATDEKFDRVVSVEMFEHMSNWRELLGRIRGWLKPDGRLFIHVFTHRSTPYRFELDDDEDWIAQHFFTGGIMPSHGLLRQFPDLFAMEQDWFWNGRHYQRTAYDWLARQDANKAAVMQVMRRVYGADAALWFRRWRLFFLATAGLFGHHGGNEWGVGHYLLRPVA